MVSPSDSDSQPLKLAILANVNVIHKKQDAVAVTLSFNSHRMLANIFYSMN